jgi:hypothetical protein
MRSRRSAHPGAVFQGHAGRPDPFIDSILNGGAAEPPQGVQVLQGKTYQMSSWPKDFESEFDGIQGQRAVVSFTALVLPNDSYVVTDYRVLMYDKFKGTNSASGLTGCFML